MEDNPVVPSSIATLTLSLPPSCIEFYPTHPNFALVGTYHLERHSNDDVNWADGAGDLSDEHESKRGEVQSRRGSIIVLEIVGGQELTVRQTLSQPSAILDLRFHPDSPTLLAAASSTASISLFSFTPLASPERKTPLVQLSTVTFSNLDPSILVLQLSWIPVQAPPIHILAFTTSKGDTRLVALDEDGWEKPGKPGSADGAKVEYEAQEVEGIRNNLEAWCVAAAPMYQGRRGFTMYAGGDDSHLRCAYLARGPDSGPDDPPIPGTPFGLPFPAVTLRSQHEAGVTAILPLPLFDAKRPEPRARLVVTGSYDDHIRLLSIVDPPFAAGQPQATVLAKENLGGGVWRLKLIDISPPPSLPPSLPTDGSGGWKIRVLASCMYAGSRVVELAGPATSVGNGRNADAWSITVLARFGEHGSMNYGTDCWVDEDCSKLRCVSTSFYDRLACLWEIESWPCRPSS